MGIRMHLRDLMCSAALSERTNSDLEMSNLYESVPVSGICDLSVSVLG